MSTDDRERFEALYRAHYGAVLAFAARRTTAGEAEEVVAETFAVAWRRLDELRRPELPWLLVVARNELANRRRAAARAREKATAAGPLAPGPGRDPADVLAERDLVLRAFGSLSEADREALALLAWDGLSPADAARVAGVSAVAFRMRASRARRRLDEALAALERAPRPTTRPLETT